MNVCTRTSVCFCFRQNWAYKNYVHLQLMGKVLPGIMKECRKWYGEYERCFYYIHVLRWSISGIYSSRQSEREKVRREALKRWKRTIVEICGSLRSDDMISQCFDWWTYWHLLIWKCVTEIQLWFFTPTRAFDFNQTS